MLRIFQHQPLPGLRLHSPAQPDRRAVERRFTGGAGQREPAVAGKLHIDLTQRNFQRRRLRRIAHQQIGNGHRRFIQRAAAANPPLALAFPAAILYRGIHAGADKFQHTPSFCGTKRTRSPERSSTGSSRFGSNNASGVRPSSCQPPGVASG